MKFSTGLWMGWWVGICCVCAWDGALRGAERPNILLAISDDQSWLHTSTAGYRGVNTPGFDRVAREGLWFHQAFAPSPGCSPTRAALLTGRHIWQIEEAGTHASSFPRRYVAYPDLLEEKGYYIGGTGKLWGPGNYEVSGRMRNPAGPGYNEKKLEPPARGISSVDYAANFRAFLEGRPEGAPFHFWYGGQEPHRVFEEGVGLRNGKKLSDVEVPPFLPDTDEVRSDLLDYCYEIEWFDRHLSIMLEILEEKGELENTLVIVTSDNGMSFPRAKANLYEYGFHMPLAIRWGKGVERAGREVDELVSLVDLAPTILEAAGVGFPAGQAPMSGRSLLPLLSGRFSEGAPWGGNAVFAGRERHSSSRWHSLSYPQRAIRTREFLYIWNLKPERWPAGAPRKWEKLEKAGGGRRLGPEHGGYHDIDACPTLSFLVNQAESTLYGKYLGWAVGRRPEEELYRVNEDAGCLVNLAEDREFDGVRQELRKQLESYLRETGDARMEGRGDVWETYPRYSALRFFPKPDWAEKFPDRVPEQSWLKFPDWVDGER